MNYKELIKTNLPNNKKEWVWFIIIIIIVIALGLFCLNQYLELIYKSQLLKSPCMLCEEFMYNYYHPNNLFELNLTITT